MNILNTKCGFVAIIGSPNAGKSTLLNHLVGQKIAIVTHKVQTTRTHLRAITVKDNSQIIFIDTPGIFNPSKNLEIAMVEAAWSGANDADIITIIIDATKGIDENTKIIFDNIGKKQDPIIILNKTDIADKNKLLKLTKYLNNSYSFENIFMVSALTGDGVKELHEYLYDKMPPSPFLYPKDQISDVPKRMLAAEIVREKLMLKIHDELPYHLTVECEKYTNIKKNEAKIEIVIFVERQSHKKIIIGSKGKMIKIIGTEARLDLEKILGSKIHLFLFVKVRENWSKDKERYKMLGLKLPKQS